MRARSPAPARLDLVPFLGLITLLIPALLLGQQPHLATLSSSLPGL